MKLSCTCFMAPGKTLTEQAQNLKKWGYEGIGVFADFDSWNDALQKELYDLEGVTGVRPCEFVFQDDSYGHLMDDNNPKLRDKARRMYREAAEICADLGAITELEYSYGPQDPLPLFAPYQKMPKEQAVAFAQVFAEIAKPVENTEGYVLLEPINRYEAPYLNSMADCIDMVNMVGAANIGVLPDMFHLSIEEKDIPSQLRAADKMIHHVHLGDNNRLMPGYGNLDWSKIIQALEDVGFHGYMSLECALSGEAESTLPAAAEFLKKMIRGGK